MTPSATAAQPSDPVVGRGRHRCRLPGPPARVETRRWPKWRLEVTCKAWIGRIVVQVVWITSGEGRNGDPGRAQLPMLSARKVGDGGLRAGASMHLGGEKPT